MSKTIRIMVPMSGNRTTLAALDLARRAAARLSATVAIFHVSDSPVSGRELLDRLGLTEGDARNCQLESVCGIDVAQEIIQAQHRMRAGIVVLHAGRSAGKISDITLSVISKISCPALVVRPDADLEAGDGQWLRRILVPLDSSPASAEAVHRAAELARAEGASLDILHIASTQGAPPTESGSLPVGLYMDHPHYDLRSWSREFMLRFFHIRVGPDDLPHAALHLASGDPAEEIIKHAERTKADLIVSAWQGQLDEGRARVVRELLARARCQLLFLVIGKTSRVASIGAGTTAAA